MTLLRCHPPLCNGSINTFYAVDVCISKLPKLILGQLLHCYLCFAITEPWPCFCVVHGTNLLAFDIILMAIAYNSAFAEWMFSQCLKYSVSVTPWTTPHLELYGPQITMLFTTFMSTTRSSLRSRWSWLSFLQKNLICSELKKQKPLLEWDLLVTEYLHSYSDRIWFISATQA